MAGVSERRDVVILGSTGSIGTQALDVVRANPDRFRVVGLTAGGSQEQLFEQQVAEFAPGVRRARRGRLDRGGRDGLRRRAQRRSPARSGCGRRVAALESGNTLALANKESLIIGGPVVTALAEPGQIVPVDSEHSALAQCLRGGRAGGGTHASSSPPAAARSAAAPASELRRRHARGGAGPPDLGHGPGRHDQLRDAGQQGARGDRGAPALRHPVRPHRGRGAPDERRALDGRVHRRLDAGPGQPARRC